jgi:hypothetical protein
MKHLLVLFAISLVLVLNGCSNTEKDISPLLPQIDKAAVYPFHYNLYQEFPEIQMVKVDWFYSQDGLILRVILPNEVRPTCQLFAVIEFIDDDNPGNALMVFLGSSSKEKFLISGIKNQVVGSVKIYYCDGSSAALASSPPYPESQLFFNIPVVTWLAFDNSVKINSQKFPVSLKHLFVELSCMEGNSLVFMGKPYKEDFEVPKSPNQNICNVRLFGYLSSRLVAYPNLTNQ